MGNREAPALRQWCDLRASDFEAHPVWVLRQLVDAAWCEERGEETFCPWAGALPVDPTDALFLVRALFTLADGNRLAGFLSPQETGPALQPQVDLGVVRPHVFLPSGAPVCFWSPMFGIAAPLQLFHLYDALDKSSVQIFPIRFRAMPNLATGLVAGTIPGFCWRDLTTGRPNYQSEF